MIRAGIVQSHLESSQELARSHRKRGNGLVLRNQLPKWGQRQKHPVAVVTCNEETSFHSGLSAISKGGPFSSPWQYRKLRGDDTVSLINSSMESDDTAWTSVSANHFSSKRVDVYDDEAHKQRTMAKIWSLACLLNCPRQRRAPMSSIPRERYPDGSVTQHWVAESSFHVDERDTTMLFPKQLDFADFDLLDQECAFDSAVSPIGEEVFETSMHSANCSSDPGDGSETSSSHGSVSQIVKEQQEFAEMLEFWLRQAQMTVQRDRTDEMLISNKVLDTNEDKENSLNPIAIDDNAKIGEVDNHSDDASAACKADMKTLLDEEEAIPMKKQLGEGNEEMTENKGATEMLEEDQEDAQNKENGTRRDKVDNSKRDSRHIKNLIKFWNKAEPKRLGRPRGLVSNQGPANDDKDSSTIMNDHKEDFVTRLTSHRIQPNHHHGQITTFNDNDEDWISRLTVSRTRITETKQIAAREISSTAASQTTTLVLSSATGLQANPSVQENNRSIEEEISFWAPQLFADSNASESASAYYSYRDDGSFSSRSDSSVSWFGMVGLESSISDDSSIRRRLKDYKAEMDPEDADFEESRQRRSPPVMLDEIDNLVTQLSMDYVQALSGLEIQG